MSHPAPRPLDDGSAPATSRPRRERRSTRRPRFPAWTRTPHARIGFIVVAIVLVLAAVGAWRVAGRVEPTLVEVPFSTLSGALARGDVASLRVEQGGRRLVAELGTPLAGVEVGREVMANMPGAGVTVADLERWSAKGLEISVAEAKPYRAPEAWLVLFAMLALIGIASASLWRTRGGSANKFVATPPERRLSLADVGGVREARADLQDVITFLRSPERLTALGARCPKGVLLVGPPGTGKTLLARAVAGEAGVPVIIAAGSDFTEMYVGVGASRVRALAKRAREAAPCIVFIDEFDSLGGRRGRPNRTSEEENTLNQLLVEMDGMGANEGVVWMAATNREDMLDPAVRRPGRFDRVVEVPLPTLEDRADILRIHARNVPLAPDVDLERLARLTPGHSGAELANLLNEAAMVAAHEESATIHARHIEQARDKILLGRVRAGVVISPAERRLIALHEAGHAVVGLVACPEDTLHKVTIEPRGRSLGAAHFAPEADRHLYARHYLQGIVAKALGGRAAELVFLGPDRVTSGAGSDLVQATSIARRMVGEFGMSERVGLVSADPSAQGGAPSAGLQGRIDEAVAELVREQADRAEALVRQHRAGVEAIAEALLVHDRLDAAEVLAIARAHGVLPPLEVAGDVAAPAPASSSAA